MSLYTTQVRTICQAILGIKEQSTGPAAWNIVDQTWEQIFNPPFPIFDEAYRETLAKKILMHYYMREIAHETPAMWQLRLNVKMNEIMPYYNKLYKAYTLEFNPLYDVDYWTTRNGNRNENKTETANRTTTEKSNEKGQTTANQHTSGEESKKDTSTNAGTAKTLTRNDEGGEGWVYENDTPQGGVDGLLNLSYLSKATKTTNTGNSSGSSDLTTSDNGSLTSSGTHSSGMDSTGSTQTDTTRNGTDNNELHGINATTENYVDHVAGKTGGKTYSAMLEEYRNSLINIDLLIIRELEDLFFGLW